MSLRSIQHIFKLVNSKYTSRHLATANLATANPGTEEQKEGLGQAIFAFSKRANLDSLDSNTLLQALTHKSYQHGKVATNERLEFLGQHVLNLLVVEHAHSKFPKMPLETLRDVVESYSGNRTLASVGRGLGLQHVMRWRPSVKGEAPNGQTTVMSKTIRAIIGALYHENGPKAAKDFIKGHILSRQVDAENLLKIEEPKRMLSALMKRQGKPRPLSRLLKETGRHSVAPVFVVGIFSGVEKIGEGYGSSIKMAEFRAAKNAVQSHFLKEVSSFVPSEYEDLPSEGQLSFFKSPVEDTPPIL